MQLGTQPFGEDKTHRMALIYRSQKAELMFVDELTLPEVNSTEVEYRRLWKQFYKTIAIEGRNNPRCRMTLMPKRYWGHNALKSVLSSYAFSITQFLSQYPYTFRTFPRFEKAPLKQTIFR